MNDNASLTKAAELVSQLTNGVLDYLVVNGVYTSVEAHTLTAPQFIGREAFFLDEVNKSMTTNVAGTLFAINAFMPLILKSDIKKVIAISSAAGDVPAVQQARMEDALPYAMSKAAVNMLIAKFALTYKDKNVVFVAMNPGFVYTMTDSLETSKCCSGSMGMTRLMQRQCRSQ
jgi:NAD(P)-dependent dehydrogenase (short-subunit alcohol dehydrogenase family)